VGLIKGPSPQVTVVVLHQRFSLRSFPITTSAHRVAPVLSGTPLRADPRPPRSHPLRGRNVLLPVRLACAYLKREGWRPPRSLAPMSRGPQRDSCPQPVCPARTSTEFFFFFFFSPPAFCQRFASVVDISCFYHPRPSARRECWNPYYCVSGAKVSFFRWDFRLY